MEEGLPLAAAHEEVHYCTRDGGGKGGEHALEHWVVGSVLGKESGVDARG